MMTNGEKNKKRFDELGLGDLPASEIARRIAVRKNGDVDLCESTLCHDCIFTGENCDNKEKEEWLADEAEPEKKEEKMEKDEIKVGDTVKVTIKNHIREGEIGTVKKIHHIGIGLNKYEVSFDDNGYGNFFSKDEIEKVKPEKKVKSKKTPPCIVVYRDGDTVTVKDLETGEEASAVCSKDDTFDLHTGAFIAMSRLTHFDTDIRLMRLEWEQIESYVSDIKMRFGALMGEGYKYPDFDEEEE